MSTHNDAFETITTERLAGISGGTVVTHELRHLNNLLTNTVNTTQAQQASSSSSDTMAMCMMAMAMRR